MIRTDFPNGVFPSVALDSGFGYMAVREGDPRAPGWIVVYQWIGVDLGTTKEIRRFGVPGGSPAFPSLYSFAGLLWLAYHDGTRVNLRNLTSGSVKQFDALSNPVAFGGGFFAYTEPVQPYRVFRLDLTSGEVTQRRLGAPTGLSRILDDGSIITVDEDRLALHGATVPSYAGGLAVGEGASGGTLWDWEPDQRGVLWYRDEHGNSIDCFTPKCAADGNRFAICTAGSGSVRLFCGSIEDLQAASTPMVEPVLRIGRPLWCGFFAGSPQAAGVWRTDIPPQSLPGNCYLEVATNLVRRKADDQVVAQYVASEGAGPAQDAINLVAAIRAAKVSRPGIPVLAYWTRQSQDGPVPAGADIVGVEAYWQKADALATMERKLRAALAKCPAAIVLAQTFTGNPGLSTDLAALVPVYARVAKDCTSVIGVIGFNGSGRASGLQDNPDVRPLWQALADGIPSAPAAIHPQEEGFVDPFRISVKENGYGKRIERGKDYRLFFEIGNGLEVEVQKDASDSLHFSVYLNGELQDRSVTERHVEVKG